MQADVVIVGAGAAGLLAAAAAASRGRSTLVLEKNSKLGVKILMSGGTRCNITHATDARGIVAALGRNGRFLHSALAALTPDDVVALLERLGVPTHVESTGKIFPNSNRALDVRDALVRHAVESGARLEAGRPVTDIESRGPALGFRVIMSSDSIDCASVIITSGGRSYPGCGTTGDGYVWAAKFGHSIVPTYPALAPLLCDAAWVQELSGVTIDDVRLKLIDPLKPRQPIDERRGSFLFAHFGLSGPVAMNLSGAINRHPDPKSLVLVASFLPDEHMDGLVSELRRIAASDGARKIGTVLSGRLPKRLVESCLAAAGLDASRSLAEIAKIEILNLANLLLERRIPIQGSKGFEKAEVTTGGVALTEIDSRTMQSKLVPGLFFAGEILDLDGPIGGYNFQAAFSTGWLAGLNA